MKKLVVSFVMLVTVFGTAIAADVTKINYRVEATFNKEFAGARAVKWDVLKRENLYQAHFIYNNERLNAFFDAEGNLIATGRFVSTANLPLLVRKTIYGKYSDYQVKEVVEYVQDNETSYLVTVENEKAKLLVRSYANGSSYIFRKERKNSIAKL